VAAKTTDYEHDPQAGIDPKVNPDLEANAASENELSGGFIYEEASELSSGHISRPVELPGSSSPPVELPGGETSQNQRHG
jgi:hypothetical protein